MPHVLTESDAFPLTESEIARLLAGYHVIVTLPVQWGDMDAFQHVNNTVYFRWYETARIAYTGRLGLGELMRQSRIGPILASIGSNYRKQITFPDTIHVGSRITRIGRTSLTMEHALVSESNAAVSADGTSTLVVFDYQTQRPVPVPDEIRNSVALLEQKSVAEFSRPD